MNKKAKALNPTKTLPVELLGGESKAATIARTVTRPTVQAAITATGKPLKSLSPNTKTMSPRDSPR